MIIFNLFPPQRFFTQFRRFGFLALVMASISACSGGGDAGGGSNTTRLIIPPNDQTQDQNQDETDDNLADRDDNLTSPNPPESDMTPISRPATGSTTTSSNELEVNPDFTLLKGSDIFGTVSPNSEDYSNLGEGRTAAVIDSDFFKNQEELIGVLREDSVDITETDVESATGYGSNLECEDSDSFRCPRVSNSEIDERASHGTRVASVIGAKYGNGGMVGVAPGVKILAVKASPNGQTFSLKNVIDALNYVASKDNIDVLNISFGMAGCQVRFQDECIGQFDPTKVTLLEQGYITQDYVDSLAAVVNKNIVIVAAAGNLATLNPDFPARMADEPETNGQIIAVGALNENGDDIASFSAKAGALKDYFVLAPGSNTVSALSENDVNPGLRSTGTSFSAPYVSGLVVLIRKKWTNLSAKQVVQIILETAEDMGEAGPDDIYGRGKVDGVAALSPINPLSFTTSSTVSGKRIAATDAIISQAGPLASALATSTSLTNAMVLDKFDRNFNVNLVSEDLSADRFSQRYYQAANLGQKHDTSKNYTSMSGFRLKSTYTPSLEDNQAKNTNNTATLMLDATWSLTLSTGNNLDEGLLFTDSDFSTSTMPKWAEIGAGLAFTRKINDEFSVKFGMASGTNKALETSKVKGQFAFVSVKYENESGFSLMPTFGLANEMGQFAGQPLSVSLAEQQEMTTTFVNLNSNYNISDNWKLDFSYYAGQITDFKSEFGVISGFKNAQMSEFDVGLTKKGVFNSQDQIRFGLVMPLVTDGGSIELRTPTGRRDNGEVTFTREKLSLANSRQFNTSIGYSLPFADGLGLFSFYGELSDVFGGKLSEKGYAATTSLELAF